MDTAILSPDRHFARLDLDDLNRIIDLDRYPLHEPDSPALVALIARCRSELDATCAAGLPDFIRPEAIARLATEATALLPNSYRFVGEPRVTYFDPDPAAEGDPVAMDVRAREHANANNQILNYQIPNNSDLRVMFLWPPLREFIAKVRRVPVLYPSQCPHLALTYKVAFEGDNDGWHYDPNDGVVTLLIQSPDGGGEFEFAPNIRSRQDENYLGVQRLLDDPDTHGTRLTLAPGTLTFFNGRNSMHRVRPVGKTSQPRIVGIFSFDQSPDQAFGQGYIDKLHQLPQGPPES